MPALRIKYPKAGEITHVLRGDRVTVGRAADNTIQIPHASISSHHAELIAADGRYQLRDLKSTNRSYVEGEPVTEYSLEGACKILFGSIECEYDPHATTTARRPLALPPPAPAPEVAFLENENRELRSNIHAMQRRFEILGTARLITAGVDRTPLAAANDAMKSLAEERDELRQQAAALRVQTVRLRNELASALRERDEAQRELEALQIEREMGREIGRVVRAPVAAPAAAPTPPQPPRVTGIAPPRPFTPTPLVLTRCADPARLPERVRALRDAMALLAAAPADRGLLLRAEVEARAVLADVPPEPGPSCRIASGLLALLSESVAQAELPGASLLRTARQAAEFLERLLDPALGAAAAALAPARILAVDDDAELRQAIGAALASSSVEIVTASSAEEAIAAIAAAKFDAILADVGLPGITGTAFCAHAREQPGYRRTPIIFLTGANTVDTRAETSLSGGSEFMAKPFNTRELALKLECWARKHQLGLV